MSKHENSDSIPKITATISLDPLQHSFSSSKAPTLHLNLTSHHTSPITIYADDISPSLMLAYGALEITDLATGLSVSNIKRNYCKFEPPSKVDVPLREDLFYTLHPNTPLTLSTPFTHKRSNDESKPLPKSQPDYGDANPNSRPLSTDRTAYGVDSLEADHSYRLTMADNSRANFSKEIRWWEYGPKELVVYGEDGIPKLDGRKVHWRTGPHPSIWIDLSEFNGLTFSCTE